MGAPCKRVVDLLHVGSVPFRPLGSSHFVPSPAQITSDTKYLPSAMTEKAMRQGVVKAMLPLRNISEDDFVLLDAYFRVALDPLWSGCGLTSYEKAVDLLNLVKSPGYPDYYTCEDKACALLCEGGLIKEDVMNLVNGGDMWLPPRS